MQCPSCHKEVKVENKDIGALYTCPLCRSVYFINFDGTPDFGEVEQPSADELKRLQNLNVPEKKKSKKQKEQEPELPELQLYPPVEDNPAATEEHTDEVLKEPFQENAQEIIQEVAEPSNVVPINFSSVASEIEDFGNQQTAVSGLSYDLEVSGLDSKEAQTLLKEAVDDARFGWHLEDLVREIRTGTCRFKNLTPVQAFILARRIQFLDVEMKWTQNVLA